MVGCFSKEAEAGSRDWSELPPELVEEIILRIDCPKDVLCFSRACQAWFGAFRRVIPMWTPANPWLLLPGEECAKGNPECVRKAYNPGNGKSYLLKLPQAFGKNCWGSDLGWIITYGLDLEIGMFNPLTKHQLHLPYRDTMMPVHLNSGRNITICNHQCKYYPYWMRECHVTQALVLKTGKSKKLFYEDDTNDDGGLGLCVAVVHIREFVKVSEELSITSTYLSIARPGDRRWTLIETPDKIYIRSVLFWKGLLWFADNKCSLWYVDIFGKGKVMGFLPKPQILFDNEIGVLRLVESFDNELLLVMRFAEMKMSYIDDYYYRCPCCVYRIMDTFRKSASTFTKRFLIYKLDFGGKKWNLAALDDLGKTTMFLGKGNVSRASKMGGTCKSNSIYFASDHIVKSGHDLGIYNLDSGTIESFYDGNDTESDVCKPIWFTPQLMDHT